MKNILHCDLDVKNMKLASHAYFDEGMNDPPALLPNAEHLIQDQRGHLKPSNPLQVFGRHIVKLAHIEPRGVHTPSFVFAFCDLRL